MDLKQNAFLRQWISPHQHRKYIHFFTINAPLEYYFFRYKEMETFTEGKKEELYSPPKTSIKRKTPRTTYVIKVVRGIF